MFREEYQLRNNEQQEDFDMGLTLRELNCRNVSKSSQLLKPLPFENSPQRVKNKDLVSNTGDSSRRINAIICLSECSLNNYDESYGYIQPNSSNYDEIDPIPNVVTHPELFAEYENDKEFETENHVQALELTYDEIPANENLFFTPSTIAVSHFDAITSLELHSQPTAEEMQDDSLKKWMLKHRSYRHI